MRDRSIHIRVEHDDYEKLVQLAGAMKMTPSAVASGLVLRGISPIDDKHEALLYCLQHLSELLQKSHVLAASAMAAAAIVPGEQVADDEAKKAQKARLREHIKEAVKYGKGINNAYDAGKLNG